MIMLDHDFRDKNSSSSSTNNWYETLIEEEEMADLLQQQGYTYKQALELIKKHGVNNVQWLLLGGEK
jgi:hypothetical protein